MNKITIPQYVFTQQGQVIRSLLLILLLLSVMFTNTFAQQKEEDVVYLKNGSVIHGEIIEQKPGEYVKIRTEGRNIWVFRMEEVDRIARETYIPARRQKPLMREKGYYNVTAIGINISRAAWVGYTSGLSAGTVNGYRFNRYLSAGLLLGLEQYYGLEMMPVAADVRGTLLKRRISTFYFGQAGYGVPLPYIGDIIGYEGGIMLHGGMGWYLPIVNNCAFVLSIGFKKQKLTKSYTNWGGNEVVEKANYNRISFKLGLMF